MEYAKKLALVPAVEAQARFANVTVPAPVRAVVSAEDEMTEILNRVGISPDEKMKLYHAALLRYLDRRNKIQEPPPPEEPREDSPEPQLPDREQHLLAALSRSKTLHWDEQGRVLTATGWIKNSNIHKIVKRLAKPDPYAGRPLAGLKQAIQELQRLKVEGPWARKWETL